MVVKKQTSKYRIVLEIPFGPVKSASDAVILKKRIKAKTPKIVFSAVAKSRTGYNFKGKLSYIKSVSAPASAIKQALMAQTGAKVSVTRV